MTVSLITLLFLRFLSHGMGNQVFFSCLSTCLWRATIPAAFNPFSLVFLHVIVLRSCIFAVRQPASSAAAAALSSVAKKAEIKIPNLSLRVSQKLYILFSSRHVGSTSSSKSCFHPYQFIIRIFFWPYSPIFSFMRYADTWAKYLNCQLHFISDCQGSVVMGHINGYSIYSQNILQVLGILSSVNFFSSPSPNLKCSSQF